MSESPIPATSMSESPVPVVPKSPRTIKKEPTT